MLPQIGGSSWRVPQNGSDMQWQGRYKLIVSGVVFALVFCLTVRPVLNAADPEPAVERNPGSLADKLFLYANDLGRALHERPLEERSTSDYRRALDAYGQVIRLNTDNYFSAESLTRKAELLREMADTTGDSALYQQAIIAYRSVVAEHTHSAFVGEALTGIAQIYQDNSHANPDQRSQLQRPRLCTSSNRSFGPDTLR